MIRTVIRTPFICSILADSAVRAADFEKAKKHFEDGKTLVVDVSDKVNPWKKTAEPALPKFPYIRSRFKDTQEKGKTLLMVTPEMVIGEEEEEYLKVYSNLWNHLLETGASLTTIGVQTKWRYWHDETDYGGAGNDTDIF